MIGYRVTNGESFAAKLLQYSILIARIKVVHVLFDHINEAIICDENQIFLLARRLKKAWCTN